MANKEWIKKGADGLTFGERLEDLIKLNKTTATALAKDTGLSQSAISDYLNKDRAPDCAAIIALARYFSVSTDYLLGLSSIKTPSADTQAVINQTGLTEENALLLVGLQLMRSQTSLSFINDLISLSTDGDMLLHYILMKSTLSVPQPIQWKDIDFDDLISDQVPPLTGDLRRYGYIHFTGKDAFEYHCSRMARAMEDVMLKKFSTSAKWRSQDGID